MPTVRKRAKSTLVGVELNRGDRLEFARSCGGPFVLELLATAATVEETTLRQLVVEEDAARTRYTFACEVRINGREHRLEREVPTPRSFYEPWEIDGVRLWLDAVDDIFGFLTETHGDCRPRRHARFALQEAARRICPEPVLPWCPLPAGGLRIAECYRGEDCWLGPYNGASAHGGLDINHPRGTPLWAPLAFADQFYFNSLDMGHNNNRWRGIRRWPDGAEWILQAHHMTALTVPEHRPLRAGEQFAWGAGVLSGAADHSHFVFKVHDEGETVLLDPWILFWQMYRDQQADGGTAAAAPA
jgi:hypothetical protein